MDALQKSTGLLGLCKYENSNGESLKYGQKRNFQRR